MPTANKHSQDIADLNHMNDGVNELMDQRQWRNLCRSVFAAAFEVHTAVQKLKENPATYEKSVHIYLKQLCLKKTLKVHKATLITDFDEYMRVKQEMVESLIIIHEELIRKPTDISDSLQSELQGFKDVETQAKKAKGLLGLSKSFKRDRDPSFVIPTKKAKTSRVGVNATALLQPGIDIDNVAAVSSTQSLIIKIDDMLKAAATQSVSTPPKSQFQPKICIDCGTSNGMHRTVCFNCKVDPGSFTQL